MRLRNYFAKHELILWLASIIVEILSFCVFDGRSFLTLTASLIGVTSLIFNAKGNPFGQVLMILFSLLYGVISYGFRYYGEMITYLGMTMPMAVFALIAWLKKPYKNKKSEVKVNTISKKETAFWKIRPGYIFYELIIVQTYRILGAIAANLIVVDGVQVVINATK